MAEAARRSTEQSDATVVWSAQPRQAAFIACPADDVGFGGARGGGKSDAVIGDWISHEEMYGAAAIGMAFRRHRVELVELMARAKQVLTPLGYTWHESDKYFDGPKGGRLRFTYLENDTDAQGYQGHSYTRLYAEEMGTFPNEAPIGLLAATLRSGHGVPCQFKGTCNPGGPGHQWVKARYGLAGRPQQTIGPIEFEFENPFTKKKIKKTRMFIPSRVGDNRYLGDDYIGNLYQSGGKSIVDKWLYGDWDAVEGAFFDSWDANKHVIRPFAIPREWLRFRSMDWGFASPFSVGWWAVVQDDFEHEGRIIPRGALVRYREWYGSTAPNTGQRLTAEQVAEGIKERDAGETIKGNSVLDPAAFAQQGGPSIGERIAAAKVYFSPADNKRVTERGAMGGWDQMRARLIGIDGVPMIYCFSTCKDSIRTIPSLQHDPDKPEDLDTDGEDHAADEWRYSCMSRPWIPKERKPAEPKHLFQAITDNTGVTRSTLTMNEIIKRLEKQARRR